MGYFIGALLGVSIVSSILTIVVKAIKKKTSKVLINNYVSIFLAVVFLVLVVFVSVDYIYHLIALPIIWFSLRSFYKKDDADEKKGKKKSKSFKLVR